jgi:hypothetical protein
VKNIKNIIVVTNWDHACFDYLWVQNPNQLSRICAVMIGRKVASMFGVLKDKVKNPKRIHISAYDMPIKKIDSKLAKRIRNWEKRFAGKVGSEYLFPYPLQEKIMASPDLLPFNKYFNIHLRKGAKEMYNLYKWRVKHKQYFMEETTSETDS